MEHGWTPGFDLPVAIEFQDEDFFVDHNLRADSEETRDNVQSPSSIHPCPSSYPSTHLNYPSYPPTLHQGPSTYPPTLYQGPRIHPPIQYPGPPTHPPTLYPGPPTYPPTLYPSPWTQPNYRDQRRGEGNRYTVQSLKQEYQLALLEVIEAHRLQQHYQDLQAKQQEETAKVNRTRQQALEAHERINTVLASCTASKAWPQPQQPQQQSRESRGVKRRHM